jgi:hypothetical protein
MKGTSPTALSFLLTLRQLAAWLVVSDSHQEPTLHVLFLSMAPAQRTESYWPDECSESKAWAFVTRVLSSPIPKLFQNRLCDILHLKSGLCAGRIGPCSLYWLSRS